VPTQVLSGEWRVASHLGPFWRLTNVLLENQNWHYKKMLKMKDDPTMCMKTQAGMTKGPATNMAFYTKMHQLSEDRQQSVGLFGQRCTDYARIGANLGSL
jgi:hypothetical protein